MHLYHIGQVFYHIGQVCRQRERVDDLRRQDSNSWLGSARPSRPWKSAESPTVSSALLWIEENQLGRCNRPCSRQPRRRPMFQSRSLPVIRDLPRSSRHGPPSPCRRRSRGRVSPDGITKTSE